MLFLLRFAVIIALISTVMWVGLRLSGYRMAFHRVLLGCSVGFVVVVGIIWALADLSGASFSFIQ